MSREVYIFNFMKNYTELTFLILLQIGKCLIRDWHWASISLPIGVLCSEEGLQLCPSRLVVVIALVGIGTADIYGALVMLCVLC